MANIKSQKKRILTNEKARLRNKAVKSELKTAAKKVETAVAAGDADTAKQAAAEASRMFDRAVSKGVVHKNHAANRKSGLTKRANSVDA
ncbi:MAG: 30S ribosomal protein S20 [Actinomycetota bacterium]|nr:30S ribosomal protein S20 [Actinomycetota bacterium]